MTDPWNDRAQQFLEKLGFTCEPEPKWVTEGRVPDFFCRGPVDLWVEVKSLPPTSDQEHRFWIFDYLRIHSKKLTGQGWAMAHASQSATQKDAKSALQLCRFALRHPNIEDVVETICIVPEEPDYTQRLHFTITTEKGPVWLLFCRSTTDEYGYPFVVQPKPWRQLVKMQCNGGISDPVDLQKIAKEDRFRLAITIIPRKEAFRLLSVGGTGGATMSRNRERVRGAIADGNNQIKNGLKYQKTPAALFVYQEGPMVADDTEFLSAMFGDLGYVFSPSNFQNGELRFGRNAEWHVGQHRSMSAICYFRDEGIPLTVHNPWADRPLPPGVIGGRECVPEDDGSLRFVDDTSDSE